MGTLKLAFGAGTSIRDRGTLVSGRLLRVSMLDAATTKGEPGMTQPIVYVDTSEVRVGQLDNLESAMNDLARFVEVNEPRLLAYNVYFTDEDTRMSVVHISPDSAALEAHMKVAGPKFPPIAAFIRMLAIDVYGRPDATLVEQFQRKAQMLGSGTVRVHDWVAGFARLPEPLDRT